MDENEQGVRLTAHVAEELRRMLVRQTELDPCSLEYGNLLHNIEVLVGTADLYADILGYIEAADAEFGSDRVVEVSFAPELAQALEQRLETGEERHAWNSAAEDTPEPEEETATEDGKVWDMTEVRAALVEARRRGVNVSALLKEFGVENFGAFPAGRYGELMKRLEE